MDVYGFYFKNAGVWVTISTTLVYLLMIGCKVISDWWIGQWSNNKIKNYDVKDYTRVYIYILGVYLLIGIFKTISFAYLVTNSSNNIFKQFIWSVLKKNMAFFDTTSSGTILNRATNDVETLDSSFPIFLAFFLENIFDVICSLVLCVIITPYMLIIILLNLAYFVSCFKLYVKSSAELRRLSKLAISPILTNTSELMKGSAVLKVFKAKDWILEKYIRNHD